MNASRYEKMFVLYAPSSFASVTVEELLKTKWPLPKKMVHFWRMEKAVLLNDAPADWRSLIQEGDKLSFPFFRSGAFGAEPVPVKPAPSILYEDDHLLVAGKPAGMKTHPNSSSEQNTLLNSVCYHVSCSGDQLPVRHVHRLDEGTTGAVLFAKHEAAFALLSKLLEQKKIFRTYYAVVDGTVASKSGTLDGPIGQDRHHPTRKRISERGQAAVTHFKKLAAHNGRTLLECRLETGRTHQIRVHLSSIGHPIAGDSLYGGSPAFPSPLLHAAKLAVPHPFENKELAVAAPVPPFFQKLFPSFAFAVL